MSVVHKENMFQLSRDEGRGFKEEVISYAEAKEEFERIESARAIASATGATEVGSTTKETERRNEIQKKEGTDHCNSADELTNKSKKENLEMTQSSKDILALASVIDPIDSANMIKDIRKQNMHRMQEFHGRLDNETGSRQPVLSLMCIKVGRR